MMNLTHSCSFVRHSGPVAAGVTAITPANGVSTRGMSGVCFLVELGAIVAGAVTSAKLQASTEIDGAVDTFADIAGTSIEIADTDDNKIISLDLVNPISEFIRCVVTRGTQNATVEGITAVLYNADVTPVPVTASMGPVRLRANAIEGTA